MNRTVFLFFIAILLTCCREKKTDAVVSQDLATTSLDTISGFYKTEKDSLETEECPFSIRIYKEKGSYRYHLLTNLRNLSGKVSFDRGESNEVYLVFEGVEWDEYEGDITNETDEDESNDDETKEELVLPTEVEAFLGKDTLTIQNTGNAMNYYVKIGECGRKFIHLIKQKTGKPTPSNQR
ncbi:hypothetical protein [Flavobacterium sp.]|uniref:hypothetical protein n=1 Tax=Flavobacterium sp. TaxID=239 RepID=UPI0039E3339D